MPKVGGSALIRFASELGMLVAYGFVGALIVDGVAASVVLGVALPVLAMFTWGAWVAPKARRRLDDPTRLLVELVLFAVACVGLAALARWPWAAGLLAAYLLGLPHRRAEAASPAAPENSSGEM